MFIKRILENIADTVRDLIKQSEALRNSSDNQAEAAFIPIPIEEDDATKLANLVTKRDIAVGESILIERKEPKESAKPQSLSAYKNKKNRKKRKQKSSL